MINAEEAKHITMDNHYNSVMPTERAIEMLIRGRAMLGKRDIKFITESKINYIKDNSEDFKTLGYNVNIVDVYGLPEVTLSW